MTSAGTDLYYDPYDFEIDEDPYPIWRRLRDEQPLYVNERYDFYALSRFDDVETCSRDWSTYISGKGTLLELIRQRHDHATGDDHLRGSAGSRRPPRPALPGVHASPRCAAIEPQIREFCARSLDPLVGSGGFDFVATSGPRCRC